MQLSRPRLSWQGSKSLFSLKKELEALQLSEAAQMQLKEISNENSPNPINVVKLKKSSKYKKPNL